MSKLGLDNMTKLSLGCAGLVLASLLAALPAEAQSSRLKPFSVSGGGKKNVTISVSYQFFLEGNTKSMSEQADLADQGRRHLYQLLAKECAVLIETIAAECRMNRANVNSQLHRRNRSSREGVRVSGSATYLIELKPNKVSD